MAQEIVAELWSSMVPWYAELLTATKCHNEQLSIDNIVFYLM